MACVRESELGKMDTGGTMTIRASVPEEPLTKAAFSIPGTGGGLHLSWQAGDQIRVINHASPSQHAAYDIQAGFTDHVASFSGAAVPGTTFDVVAPGSYTSVAAAAAGNPTLTQDGNNNTDHLVFTALLSNVAKADLADIGFTPDWVSAHPGTTLKRGGVVKFVLTLPGAITAPKKVVLSGFGEEICVNITNVNLSSAHVLTAYAQSGWEDVAIPAGTQITVAVLDGDDDLYVATKILAADATLEAGAQNTITIADGFSQKLFMGGNGSQASPYLIANAKQLDNMHAPNILKHQERVYFRLIDDIDMTACANWEPLNWQSPYDYIIDFDGDDHIISHFTSTQDGSVSGSWSGKSFNKPSLFGLLYGSCYGVTFTNATISTNYGTCGVLGGYLGYDGKRAEVYNVHVKNSTIGRTGAGDSGIGAFAGRIALTFMDSCSAEEVTINASSYDYVGGLFGLALKDASRVRNCWTSGTIHGNQKVGGISGGLISENSELINCYSIATVDAVRFGAGIVGECCLDANSGDPKHYTQATTLQPGNVVQGCIAWQSSFATRDTRSPYVDAWASGAIVGLTATHNYLTDCKRNAALDTHWTEVNGVTPYDQENAGPSTALVINNPQPSTMKHYFPYHGKAYSGTLSNCAHSLGWDETVWDLSGSLPVLTGAVQTDTPISSGAASCPGNDSLRGLGEIRPTAGDGWTITSIRNGITYYQYSGYCSQTEDKWQDVYIIDYDLSNTDYEVKIVYSNPDDVCSGIFAKTGAVAAINGGYEKPSIALKANSYYDTEESCIKHLKAPVGYPVSYMPNNTIGDTGVRNWKSEGTFYCDGERGIEILFDGYDGSTTTKTKTVKQERLFYQLCTDDKPGFVSSAPMLIHDFSPYGRTFKDRNPKESTSSEDPNTHQRGQYPRTAVALTEGGHLLLVVCDGRYKAGYGGNGMSAYWLTVFLATHFNPQYALNLDGGGSSTMCVEGQGDGITHVVNYPCDSDEKSDDKTIHTHGGERSRDSFIVIVPKY